MVRVPILSVCAQLITCAYTKEGAGSGGGGY